MANIQIGSARIDENGRISGGRPGDQNGREVCTQSYYAHPKGWRVLRCRSAEKARRIAQAMRAACKNENIGYSQSARNALYKQVSGAQFDPARADVPTSTDCSALVRVCLAYAGILTADFTTATEAAVLLRTGAFTEIALTSAAVLREGDILVTRTKGHTAVVVSGGARGTVVSAGDWHLRSGAGTDFAALGTLRGGTAVEVLETAPNGWRRVAVPQGVSFAWLSPKAVTDV